MWCADAGIVRSTVRVDRSSGRLVRTQLVLPREVPTLEVIAQESSSSATPSKFINLAVGRAQVDEIVEQSAAVHGVDPLLVRSVMQVESNYNPNALSQIRRAHV